jgi:outer membrane lipopolysaccharide assembly protein LptE/RlpB
VSQSTAALIDRIDVLLEKPGTVSTVERTLTDGYAQALALEAERRALEREIRGAVANTAAAGDLAARLCELGRRHGALDRELGSLRARLADLRRVRSAGSR